MLTPKPDSSFGPYEKSEFIDAIYELPTIPDLLKLNTGFRVADVPYKTLNLNTSKE